MILNSSLGYPPLSHSRAKKVRTRNPVHYKLCDWICRVTMSIILFQDEARLSEDYVQARFYLSCSKARFDWVLFPGGKRVLSLQDALAGAR